MWIEKQNGSQIILNKSKRQKKFKILKNRKKMLMPVRFFSGNRTSILKNCIINDNRKHLKSQFLTEIKSMLVRNR